MGRLFEALRQAAGPRVRQEETMSEPVPAVVAEPEVPYIEVGPRHSIDASPEVLAGGPARRSPAARPAEPVAGTQVSFRPLPAGPRFAPELVAYHSPDGAAAEQYREVLAALLPAAGARAGEGCPVLLFAGSQPEVGATTVLLNVAITAARQGRRRVVVVDAHLRRPAVASRLSLAPAPGLREVLRGTAGLDQALRQTGQANLLALTAGLAESGSGTRFVAETLRSLLRQLRQRADLALIDGPPWDGRPEVVALATAADAVCVVVPEQEAETAQSDALLQSVADSGARLAGCILSSAAR
jgi:Mrp family chromosome partitioning ATPase